ncbi:Cycloartenol-C-24-methyltransferase 1 [Triticum urartu]|uniref:Methyltransferase n=1 Tax=Triticum urartu TaxID=4572 RepID=M7Z6B5_TRIUA|nr:Cycloartenol-C-24-methyltransferase 1 [Triticum urartu]
MVRVVDVYRMLLRRATLPQCCCEPARRRRCYKVISVLCRIGGRQWDSGARADHRSIVGAATEFTGPLEHRKCCNGGPMDHRRCCNGATSGHQNLTRGCCNGALLGDRSNAARGEGEVGEDSIQQQHDGVVVVEEHAVLLFSALSGSSGAHAAVNWAGPAKSQAQRRRRPALPVAGDAAAAMSKSGALDLASGLGGKIDKEQVNKYYDLATSFYEYGWGESFHFAHRWNGESLRESIKRHEHFLALQLELKPGMKALNRSVGLGATCDFVKADFMKMPFSDNTFDAVYAIEATCHAPDPVDCYKEIYRVLKPGQCFAVYEWCITDHYDPNNATHKRIKDEIELGNGLPDIRSTRQCLQAVKDAGFEVKVLEYVGLAPEGSQRVSSFLEKAAEGLVEGGNESGVASRDRNMVGRIGTQIRRPLRLRLRTDAELAR